MDAFLRLDRESLVHIESLVHHYLLLKWLVLTQSQVGQLAVGEDQDIVRRLTFGFTEDSLLFKRLLVVGRQGWRSGLLDIAHWELIIELIHEHGLIVVDDSLLTHLSLVRSDPQLTCLSLKAHSIKIIIHYLYFISYSHYTLICHSQIQEKKN